jgi:hypothetical protein
VETFTAVSNPAEGANPSALKYYEKDATTNEYFRSTDTTVQNGKTYYTRAVSQPNG